MAMKDPAAVAAKWVSKTQGATQDYRDGVMAVTTSPGAAAVAKRDKWRTGLQNSEAKWVANTGRVTTEEWRSATLDKGAARLATGVAAAEGKYAARMGRVLQHIETVKAAISNMDDTTLEGRIAKSAEFQRRMAAIPR